MFRILNSSFMLVVLAVSQANAAEVPAWQPGGSEARIGRPYYYSVPTYVVTAPRATSWHRHGAAVYGVSGTTHAGHCGDCGCQRRRCGLRCRLGCGLRCGLFSWLRCGGCRHRGECCNGHAGGYHGAYYGGSHYGGSHYGGASYGASHAGDPYRYHFGPGFYRQREHGHYRFPYYSYRRPWYHPGPPVFNRDTNFVW